MSGPQVWSRDPGGSDEYPWELPFRDAVGHLRLGMLDVRVLDQSEVWVDSAGGVHRIRDLTDEHLANVVILLRRRAVEIMLDYAVASELGRFTPRTPLPPMTAGVGRLARNWVMQTPLWDALQGEVRARWRRRRKSWTPRPATGAWDVQTENSRYVLDWVRSRAMRLPDQAAGELRRDGVWAVLHAAEPVQVGRPMTLHLTVTDDPDVAVTIRVTSPVVAIYPLLAPPDGTARRLARASEPERVALTSYRTALFIAAAGDIRAFWAALNVLLTRHNVPGALIVPSRLRDPDADDSDADLLVKQGQQDERPELQAEVQAALGYRLPVTTIADYPGRTRADVTSHAVALSPGWSVAAHYDPDAPRREET